MTKTLKSVRQDAVSEMKRDLILEAARRVFERESLENASLRAIAREAGYTPAALYFHFDSKEAIYAELLGKALDVLKQRVDAAVAKARGPEETFKAAACAYFDFYLENPKDLDLGFYLSGGGMAPKGVGRMRDDELNSKLLAAIGPVETAARELGASSRAAQKALAEFFVYANGVLLLVHTGRLGLFKTASAELMESFISSQIGKIISGGRS